MAGPRSWRCRDNAPCDSRTGTSRHETQARVSRAPCRTCDCGTLASRQHAAEFGFGRVLADLIGLVRGKYIGRRLGDPPKDEAEHFMRCPARRSIRYKSNEAGAKIGPDSLTALFANKLLIGTAEGAIRLRAWISSCQETVGTRVLAVHCLRVTSDPTGEGRCIYGWCSLRHRRNSLTGLS